MATILVYEPKQQLAQNLFETLQKEKHNAVLCRCDQLPEETWMKDNPVSLVVLDAQMKWSDCRPLLELFSHHGCAILFITDDRSMRAHLHALYAGRSEVMTQPFTMKAFRAKVQEMLAEAGPVGDLVLDETEHAAVLDGRRVELTAQEYALLLALMENPDIPVSREQLLRTAWGYQSMGETRTVDVHVQRLRKKLGSEFIETVYKCGYRLRLA